MIHMLMIKKEKQFEGISIYPLYSREKQYMLFRINIRNKKGVWQTLIQNKSPFLSILFSAF